MLWSHRGHGATQDAQEALESQGSQGDARCSSVARVTENTKVFIVFIRVAIDAGVARDTRATGMHRSHCRHRSAEVTGVQRGSQRRWRGHWRQTATGNTGGTDRCWRHRGLSSVIVMCYLAL